MNINLETKNQYIVLDGKHKKTLKTNLYPFVFREKHNSDVLFLRSYVKHTVCYTTFNSAHLILNAHLT
jgi:hypothetical protein